MGEIKLLHKIKYSYLINNIFAENSSEIKSPLVLNVISDNEITFTLEPKIKDNVKLMDIIKFNVFIKNTSSTPIDCFYIKLNCEDTVYYLADTLINTNTGKYYPSSDWQNSYSKTESIAPNESLNLTYVLQVVKGSSNYLSSPIDIYNSAQSSSVKSNISSLYISQAALNISSSVDKKIVYIENCGNIISDYFMYKYKIPSGTIYKRSTINSTPFADITYYKLGSYAFFKIGPLPVSTPLNIKILNIIFE
ncbi:MAG: hypothetical protein Q4F66_12205 [Clostridium sp.]|nr:hypothetical protein [Clostridium sp.]